MQLRRTINWDNFWYLTRWAAADDDTHRDNLRNKHQAQRLQVQILCLFMEMLNATSFYLFYALACLYFDLT